MNTKLLRLNDLANSPLWDTGNRKFLHRWEGSKSNLYEMKLTKEDIKKIIKFLSK